MPAWLSGGPPSPALPSCSALSLLSAAATVASPSPWWRSCHSQPVPLPSALLFGHLGLLGPVLSQGPSQVPGEAEPWDPGGCGGGEGAGVSDVPLVGLRALMFLLGFAASTHISFRVSVGNTASSWCEWPVYCPSLCVVFFIVMMVQYFPWSWFCVVF